MTPCEHKSFLLVEDDWTNRQLMRSGLETLGASEIYEAEDLTEALTFLETTKPDIILCDWYLGDESGLTLFSAVQEKKEGDTPRFILISGERDRGVVTEATELGIKDYITKPFTREQFISELSELLCQTPHHKRVER